ncbi:MAG: Stp1/IreP family PP2C-type Ser/Thr phosphatase [Elusimicrobiota bacterium]
MKNPNIEFVGKTDPGRVRERNEDSIGLDEDLGLLVVADGMGGHNSGEVASSLAIETILQFARKMLGGAKPVVPSDGDPKQSVRSRQLAYFIRNANTVIFEKARAFPKDHGMGTTVVAVLADDKSITVAHVGDSRLYVYRNGAIERLTEDHSLVMDQVKHGLITEEQAEKSHLQNILTRALGTEENVQVDVQDHPAFPGDVFLLCSDGLTKELSEPEIAEVLGGPLPLSESVDKLIEMALTAGGRDNVTVGMVRVKGGPNKGVGGFLFRLLGK